MQEIFYDDKPQALGFKQVGRKMIMFQKVQARLYVNGEFISERPEWIPVPILPDDSTQDG